MLILSDLLRRGGGGVTITITNNANTELWKVVVWCGVTSVMGIVQEIQTKTFEWVSRRSSKGGLNWNLWMANPIDCCLVKKKCR